MRKVEGAWRLWVPMIYYTLMELLQFVQYFYLADSEEQCGQPMNEFLTIIGWLHISFQPVFSTIHFSFSVTKKEHQYIMDRMVLPLAIIAGIFLSSKLIMPDIALCDPNVNAMCSTATCTLMGNVHLKWHLKLRGANYFTPSTFLHAFMMFAPPLVLKNWFGFLSLLLTGPLMAYFVSGGGNAEWASIWCYVSVLQSVIGAMIGLKEINAWETMKKKDEKKEN